MTAEQLILIIEDDLQTRRFLKSSLNHRGWRTVDADCAKTGLALLNSENPDLVILDLGLPDMDGIAVTRRLRQLSDLPILILSARSQEQNKIMALDAGADDYLTKPFGSGELHARLQALLRRVSRSFGSTEVFETGRLKVDLARRQVFLSDHEVRITPIEYRLLSMLVRHAGAVVTHRQLLQEVWGAEHIHDQHYLRIYMGQLRHKLEANPARPRYLLTEIGVGYRLSVNEEVKPR
ncbi:response regulator [Methylomicrobium album]|uniref:Response regulator with CheY-like receiver domain and winged-helix DNA-binding domain n=1 Tax=Methylomicrobium album BG8 TaxID=686340 RepID=H8GLT8_METAL|nr:response regulator [Methylomicrobium album]EIC30615.1 response regulator with CheY-like receiver domain and winged-helix DNA-binding domain [Methylomicrobium album BG8]